MTAAEGAWARQGIGFIGAGAVGTTLALALQRAGYPVRAVSSRTPASAQRLAASVPGCQAVPSAQAVAEACGLVFLTVTDDAIAPVAASVRWRAGQAVVHCSGATSLDVLEPARRHGASIGSLHPLQAFANPLRALAVLPGTAFAIDADPPLQGELETLVRALGGWSIAIAPDDRALYHASVVMACGLLLALMERAGDLWRRFGDSKGGLEQGIQALLPMARASLETLGQAGPVGALTGPWTRGDIGTIRRHLEALRARAPGHLPLYCHLALAVLPLALAKGLSQEKAIQLQRLLEEALNVIPSISSLPMGEG